MCLHTSKITTTGTMGQPNPLAHLHNSRNDLRVWSMGANTDRQWMMVFSSLLAQTSPGRCRASFFERNKKVLHQGVVNITFHICEAGDG
jgi:hypothetical protein